jgi:hypothetical protein
MIRIEFHNRDNVTEFEGEIDIKLNDNARIWLSNDSYQPNFAHSIVMFLKNTFSEAEVTCNNDKHLYFYKIIVEFKNDADEAHFILLNSSGIYV